MSYAGLKYREIRFILEDELTQAYVLIDAIGDCPIGVQGWHHKTFPPSVSIRDLVERFIDYAPVTWPLEAPPSKV